MELRRSYTHFPRPLLNPLQVVRTKYRVVTPLRSSGACITALPDVLLMLPFMINFSSSSYCVAHDSRVELYGVLRTDRRYLRKLFPKCTYRGIVRLKCLTIMNAKLGVTNVASGTEYGVH